MTQYYFETLPLHPQPEPMESLVSYLIRVSEANAILHTSDLDAMADQKASTTIREWSDYPRAFETLQKLTACSSNVLMKTTFYHLGRKFGRSAGGNELHNFLLGSVNVPSLRYCPMCLSEHPYYPLTWRFLAVQGCHVHACQILEKCGHCGCTLPGYASPLRMARCPKCNGDLRTCSAQPLSVEEYDKAITQFEDLEFLLSPQPWEESYNALPKLIGQAMMFLRRAKGLTLKRISQQSGLTVSSMNKLEHCFSGSEKGASYRVYSEYAAFLGITLRDLFGFVLRDELNQRNPTTSKSKIPFTEDELVEKALHAVEELRASGIQVTRKNIFERMGVQYSSLFNAAYLQSPRVQELLMQIDDEVHNDQKRQQERDSNNMLVKVQQAIQQLKDCGEVVTFQSVGNIIGISSRRFIHYPKAQDLIKQHARYHHHKTQQSRLREDEITDRVQRTIELLEETKRRVTETSVCRIAGISRSCLETYPCVRTLIEQHADHRRLIQLAAITQRENELLIRIEEAIRTLHSLNQRVTQKSIAAIVGMRQVSLRRYPRVKEFLEEKAGMYHHNTRTYSQVREDELVAQVKAAKEQLDSSGRKVTQWAVAEILGMSANGLMHYPEVRIILFQEKNANRSRSVQVSLEEEKLLVDLEKVIQQLEEQEIAITIPKLSASVGISRTILHRYPRCVSVVTKAMEDQKRKQFKLREDGLLLNVHKIIQQLRGRGLPVTVTAIAQALHKSRAYLNYYPRVRSVFEQIAKGHLGAL